VHRPARAAVAEPVAADDVPHRLHHDRGSSGGGWFRVVDGKTELVSNTSIGPTTNTWLAGPQLGKGAETLYQNMSRTYGGR
jgi:hypothetical protein